MYSAHIDVDWLYTCTECTLSWKRTLKNWFPPCSSWTVMFVYIALVHYGMLLEKDRGNCERTRYVFFNNVYAPLFLLLINTVHGLTLLVIVDFPFECYTWPSEVRFGAEHRLWVYFLYISASTLLLLGLLMYIDGGRKPDCWCVDWLYMICVAVFSLFSLLQGLVRVPEKFETWELKPLLYRAHPLWTCSDKRTEKLDQTLRSILLTRESQWAEEERLSSIKGWRSQGSRSSPSV